MYKMKVLLGWIMGNGVYIIVVKNFMGSSSEVKNDGHFNYIIAFTFFISSLSVFKFFFAALHILNMKRLFSEGCPCKCLSWTKGKCAINKKELIKSLSDTALLDQKAIKEEEDKQ